METFLYWTQTYMDVNVSGMLLCIAVIENYYFEEGVWEGIKSTKDLSRK